MTILFFFKIIKKNKVKMKQECFQVDNSFQRPNCLILIDSPMNYKMVEKLSQNSKLIICTEGGATRLYKTFKNQNEIDEIVPNVMIGAMDSIPMEIKTHYHSKNVMIKEMLNETTTDLEKAITFAMNHDRMEDIQEIVIYDAFAGRLDRAMANLSELYKCQTQLLQMFPQRHIQTKMIGEMSMVMCLLHGDYEYQLMEQMEMKDGVGIFPAGQKSACVTTQGLKWDLNEDMPLEFGSFISSSNRMVSPTIKIMTKSPIFFITQMEKVYQIML